MNRKRQQTWICVKIGSASVILAFFEPKRLNKEREIQISQIIIAVFT